jgi:hypothetical protein
VIGGQEMRSQPSEPDTIEFTLKEGRLERQRR